MVLVKKTACWWPTLQSLCLEHMDGIGQKDSLFVADFVVFVSGNDRQC
jgi:hypothetical protein